MASTTRGVAGSAAPPLFAALVWQGILFAILIEGSRIVIVGTIVKVRSPTRRRCAWWFGFHWACRSLKPWPMTCPSRWRGQRKEAAARAAGASGRSGRRQRPRRRHLPRAPAAHDCCYAPLQGTISGDERIKKAKENEARRMGKGAFRQ